MSIIKADALEATAAFNPQHVPQHAVIQASLAEATLSEEIDLGPPAGMTSSAGSDGAAPASRLAARLLGAAEEKSGEERLRTRPGQQGLGSSLDGSLEANTDMELPAKEAPVVDLEAGLGAPGDKVVGLIGDDPEASGGGNEQQGAKSQQTWVREQGPKCANNFPAAKSQSDFNF